MSWFVLHPDPCNFTACFMPTKASISSGWPHGTARKFAYFRRSRAAISGQCAPFMLWLSTPSFFLCFLIDLPLEMVLCLFVLLHAPTLLLSDMMANSSRIGCQLLWVLCVEPIWTFYYIKLLSQLLREEKLKRNHVKKKVAKQTYLWVCQPLIISEARTSSLWMMEENQVEGLLPNDNPVLHQLQVFWINVLRCWFQ